MKNNLMHEWRFTLPIAMLALFMTIVTGGFDLLIFFLMLYYIAYCEFEKEIASA